jgi:hypothetical protein
MHTAFASGYNSTSMALGEKHDSNADLDGDPQKCLKSKGLESHENERLCAALADGF